MPRLRNGATARHGSLSVHLERGTWHDFEADAGGGVLDLVQHATGCDKAGALAWLVDARLIDPPAGADARPAAPARAAAARVSAPIRPKPAPAPLTLPPRSWPPRCRLTTARAYLARRRTWPADGPPLPDSVRWLPADAWSPLPSWPGRDGRPRRLTPPVDGVSSLLPGAAPAARCGAVVFELARPGCAPDAGCQAGHDQPPAGGRLRNPPIRLL